MKPMFVRVGMAALLCAGIPWVAPSAALAAEGYLVTPLGEFLPGGDDSFAAGIDADGRIYGSSSLADGSGRAFVTIDGVMTDLNTLLAPGADPGCTLDGVFGFNAAGQIGAVCTPEFGGFQSVFLLTPVPEPATAALFGLGLMALGAVRRRRR